jgi:hypothetical protein
MSYDGDGEVSAVYRPEDALERLRVSSSTTPRGGPTLRPHDQSIV